MLTISNEDLADRMAHAAGGDCSHCVADDSCDKNKRCKDNILLWLKGEKENGKGK